jgi:pimeloyl-ACP methyl ester carboxylesterase
MTLRLYTRVHGHTGPTLLLLHGLGANGEVWCPLIDTIVDAWPGRIVVPDLRGHGRSPHAAHYEFGHHAADVAGLFERGERISVLGHSMGAAIGLALATGWYGVDVAALVGIGVKVMWRDEELRKADELTRAPVKWFDRRDDAVMRFLRVSGLEGLFAPGHPVVDAGVVEQEGRYRLAADIATAAAAGPDVRDMLRIARAPASFACGSRDVLVTPEELRTLDPAGVVLDGLGHNLHAEDPVALWTYAQPKLSPDRHGRPEGFTG